MGRKRKTVTTEEEELETHPPVDQPPQPEQPTREQVDFKTFIQSLAPVDARVKIWRFDDAGREVFQGVCQVDSVSEEFIQTRYGEGDYTVRLVNPAGTYVGTRKISIGPAPIKEPTPIAVPQPVESREQLLSMQIEALRTELNNQRELVYRLVDRLGAGDGRPSSGIGEVAEALKMLHGFAQPPTMLNSIADIISVVKQLRDISAGSGEGETRGVVGVIKDVVQAVPEALAAMRGTASVERRNFVPALPDTAPPAQITAEDSRLGLLRVGINYLKAKARARSDVGLYVDFIADNFNDPQWYPFVSLLERPYEEVTKIDAELLQPLYRPWFESLLNELRNAISDRSVTTGTVRDASDASGDEDSGASQPVPESSAGNGA